MRFLYSDVCFSFFYLIISLSFYFPVYFYLVSVFFVIMSILFPLKHVSLFSIFSIPHFVYIFFSNLFSPSLYFSVLYELSPEKGKKSCVQSLLYTSPYTDLFLFFFFDSRLYHFHFSNEETPEKLWSVSCSYIMM